MSSKTNFILRKCRIITILAENGIMFSDFSIFVRQSFAK